MQASRRFLQCLALQRRRAVAVFQQRPSQRYDAFASFGTVTSLKRAIKKAQSVMLCAFEGN
jgi:hypothetical protein